MNSRIAKPVENPLLKSSVDCYVTNQTQPFHVINLTCAVCEKKSFSVKVTGDSFFCFCDSCGASHQLSANKAASKAAEQVAELLIQRYQPKVEVVEVAA